MKLRRSRAAAGCGPRAPLPSPPQPLTGNFISRRESIFGERGKIFQVEIFPKLENFQGIFFGGVIFFRIEIFFQLVFDKGDI